MPFIVVYDSNVLYPNTLRDLLIRLAQSGIVQAKWTDRILDEVFDNIAKNRVDIDPGKLALLRRKMSAAIADVRVTGYESFVDVVRLPDPDDRHVRGPRGVTPRPLFLPPAPDQVRPDARRLAAAAKMGVPGMRGRRAMRYLDVEIIIAPPLIRPFRDHPHTTEHPSRRRCRARWSSR
ncbi:MAG TPA: PIN domain-containing protein [Actinocrinis sp.]|nr:PIN domain-containing protein [Actinocrinis sp.]